VLAALEKPARPFWQLLYHCFIRWGFDVKVSGLCLHLFWHGWYSLGQLPVCAQEKVQANWEMVEEHK